MINTSRYIKYKREDRTYELVSDPNIIYEAQRKIKRHEMYASMARRKKDHTLARQHQRRANAIRHQIFKRFGIWID